jgi:hypothetical protein
MAGAMFGLFKAASFTDPVLGELTRSHGYWRGLLQLDSASVPIALAGTRAAPDPLAVAAVLEVPARLSEWRSVLEAALFEHYEPYAEALAGSEIPAATDACLPVTAPAGIWPHVTLEYISVSPLDGALTTELGYTTAWDEEHTLGARFQQGGFVELCGSVLPP